MSDSIQKRRILLASVLKPVDEPRMFERMGQSLAANGFEVFIMGFPPSSNQGINGIHFIPHQKFSRVSLARIIVRLTILRNALLVKPGVLIISTHELIGVAILFKLFTGRKIVYDVQENYWMNIMNTNAWPKAIRWLVATLVRLKERITSPLFSKFFLAEQCYVNELPFLKKKSVVIENKCLMPKVFQRNPGSETIELVFTGTIAESTGVFEAIHLAKKLNEAEPEVRLTIIGQCSISKVLERIKNEISGCLFISLKAGNDFISHNEIMQAISKAHFGIVFYPASPHTENKFPTKLYEYLACQLPILLQKNKQWIDLCEQFQAAIAVDFNNPNVDFITKQVREGKFYRQIVENAFWQSEETKFLTSIRSVPQ